MNTKLPGVKIDGTRVRSRRKALGLTQEDLVAPSGLTQGTIAKLENGQIQGRSRETQDRLAAALQTSVEYLCGQTDDPTVHAPASHAPVPYATARGGEPRLERDAPEHHPELDETPFETGLFRAMDPDRYTAGDFDAVRRAIRETHRLITADIDLVAMAREWLEAARQLRIEGHAVTTTAIATRVAVGKMPHVQRRAERADADATADADANARARGFVPGSKRHVVDAVLARNKKRRRAGDE